MLIAAFFRRIDIPLDRFGFFLYDLTVHIKKFNIFLGKSCNLLIFDKIYFSGIF